MTRLAVVIGNPVHHSLSPTIVNVAFEEMKLDWKMVTVEVPEKKVGIALDQMRELEMGGMSVTMPHKATVAEILATQDLAELHFSAVALGAVNCVALEDGKLIGHNTDGTGFLFSLKREGVEVSGSSVLIFGAGGASWAIANACILAGATRVGVCARSESKAELLISNLGGVCEVASSPIYSEFEILVNATPLGMELGVDFGKGEPNQKNLIDEAPLDATDILKTHIVIDIVYNPRETKLMSLASDKGAKVVGGIGMLVGQAFEAVKIWTGVEPNPEIMFHAAK